MSTSNAATTGWHAAPADGDRPGRDWEPDYRAMVLALRDYLGKTGFNKVLLGLSGGIDSAIVATIAADALGPDNVRCVMLPSEYTSEHSLDDAAAVAKALGCRLDTLPIEPGRAAIEATSRRFSRAPNRTSPRKTSSPACAACC